jgi:hypothetical protein
MTPFIAAQILGSVAGFAILSSLLPDGARLAGTTSALLTALTLASLAIGLARGRHDVDRWMDGSILALAGMVIGTFAISTGYVLFSYAAIPVDLVSFAESSFINDIIKWRTGVPLYTPGVDNNSYPYMPGTQLLTAWLAAALGDPTSISLMRHIALSYVVAAAVLAAFAADRMIVLTLPGRAGRTRPLWWWIFACAAWLAATDHRFNMFVHSLHNDGLALLVVVAAFSAVATHLHRPSALTWGAMALLPAAGYLVKQNLLIWAPLLALVLLVSGRERLPRVAALSAATALLAVLVTWYGYLNWGGEDFRFWVFSALGTMGVSRARSAQNLLNAGGYVVGLLTWSRLILLEGTTRPAFALLLATGVLVLGEAYTSGIGFTPNHLGPGVVLATLWGMLAIVRSWPDASGRPGRLVRLGHCVILAALPLFFAGGLGLVREPRNGVPPDLARYVAAIEAEFADLPAEQVLLDMGSWPYLHAGVVMKDRGDPVALHAGSNLTEIRHELFADTIARIRARSYSRILARSIEGDATPYDFQRAGTGIRQAILEEYHIVRRIPAVTGVREWWPDFLLHEVAVLEPRDPAAVR